MANIPPDKLAEWTEKARLRDAVVPRFFEVFPTRITIECGKCGHRFARNLVPHVNDPTFICPNKTCGVKNWAPITYDRPT